MTAKAKYLVTDRSACETDDKCGMRLWWNRYEGGIGIVPKEDNIALAVGKQVHADLALLGQMENISPFALDEVINEMLGQLTDDDRSNLHAMELLYRRLGWFAAWGIYLEPKLRGLYENVFIEGEIILDRDPLIVPVTPDRVLKPRGANGPLIYKEFKSVTNPSKRWIESWPYRIQMHLGLAAIGEELKQPMHFGQIVGLNKGHYDEHGRLRHPYVWGYYNTASEKWTHDYALARAATWVPMPVWEYPGGVTAWVQLCGEGVAMNMFPHSPPIFLNKRMLDLWVERQTHRQRRLAKVAKECITNIHLRNIHFPMRMDQCKSDFGFACPYLKCCWNAETNKHPLADDSYVVREPHHDVEIIGVEDDA